jgi:hypothetical protein
MRKFLIFLKDLATGLLYLGLTGDFILLVAAAMLYFKPQDFLVDAALFPRNPHHADVPTALGLGKLGLGLALGCSAAAWLLRRAEAWLSRREAKKAAEAPLKETA